MIIAYLIWSILIRFLSVMLVETLYAYQRTSGMRPLQPHYYEILSWAIYFVMIVPIFRALGSI